jgi:hypothetical protein
MSRNKHASSSQRRSSIKLYAFQHLTWQDQRQALTIAFHLILNRQDHLYNIENNLPKYLVENRELIERKLNNYQEI